MSRSRLKGLLAIAFVASLLVGAVSAQENQAARDKGTQKAAAADQSTGSANDGAGEILTNTTEKAAHASEAWGHRLGLSKDVSFGVSVAVNFAGIVLFWYLLLKSRLPHAFRERTAAIQKGIREAQAASADASRRLTGIEVRLSKLDAEVQDIRSSAEREAAAEEQRILQAAEQDKQKIIEGAEAEIEAIARNARRELKGYAASLAVDLAGHQIHVDEPTDHALVHQFVDQLGKDGQ